MEKLLTIAKTREKQALITLKIGGFRIKATAKSQIKFWKKKMVGNKIILRITSK